MASAAVIAAPAPQTHALHEVVHAPTFVRTASIAPNAVSHAHHTAVHTPTTVVRTVPHALHHVVAQPATTVVRTAAARPVVRVAHTPAVQPVGRAVEPLPAYEHVEEEVEVANPNYSFGYSVADVRSGDAKTREETRDGDVVTGSYTVADPDGRLRRVTYTADHINGFQATVTYDGKPGPVAIPIDAPAKPAVAVAAAASPDFVPFVPAAPQESVIVAARAEATFLNPAPFTTQVFRNGDLHAHHRVHTAAAPVVRFAHAGHIAHPAAPVVRLASAGHFAHAAAPTVLAHHTAAAPAVVRLANGNLVRTAHHSNLVSTPFGLRALSPNTHFVANNGGFIRAIQPAFTPVGTTLVHHQEA